MNKINNGFTNIFSIAIAKATQTAVDIAAISTPGKIAAKANTANAVKTIFKMKFISNYLQSNWLEPILSQKEKTCKKGSNKKYCHIN